MKQILCMITLMAAFLASCGSVDKEEPQTKPEYKIILSNDMYYFKAAKNYDRYFYDICLISSGGYVYELGKLPFGDAEGYTLPETHKEKDMLVPALKVGKNEEDARNSYYLCPEFAKGTLQILFVLDGKKTVYSFTEDLTWRQMKFKTAEELRQFAKEIAIDY